MKLKFLEHSAGIPRPCLWKRAMRNLPHLLLVACVVAGSCTTGKVKPDTNDQTPPTLTLSVTALDPDTNTTKSVTAQTGSSMNLKATEGSDIIIVASAKDPGGVKVLRIWNVGAHLKNMAKGEVLGSSTTAYTTVGTVATMKALPGFKLGVFAEAQNYGSGSPSQTKVTSGVVALQVSGSPEPVFTGGTGTTPVTFTWNSGAKAYVSAGAPSPAPGAQVVGIEVGNPFGGGVHMSLYRGSGNINSLDLRTDFVRIWQQERANFFNGNWSSQPWYALRANTREQGFSSSFSVDLRWED